MRRYRDLAKDSPKPSLSDTVPAVGQQLEIVGRSWNVSDHSSYDNPEGYHVDEWECARTDAAETAFLLRETGADASGETRWFFTRPIATSSITLDGGKPFADVAATVTTPPEALVYRGLAHGFDEQTDGTYHDDPGDQTGKTTWDYWDAKHEMNLAVERWADGRVECFYGRRIDPAKARLSGSATDQAGQISRITASVASGARPRAAVGAVQGCFVVVVLIIVSTIIAVVSTSVRGSFVDALTVIAAIVAASCLRYLFVSSQTAMVWLIALGVLVAGFCRFPPLTTLPGIALLLAVPAGAMFVLARSTTATGMELTRGTAVAAGIATAIAGGYHFYQYAPRPPSFGQFVLAFGPAPVAALVATVVAFGVGWMAGEPGGMAKEPGRKAEEPGRKAEEPSR